MPLAWHPSCLSEHPDPNVSLCYRPAPGPECLMVGAGGTPLSPDLPPAQFRPLACVLLGGGPDPALWGEPSLLEK